MSKQIGRIGGHLLQDQLVRSGTDLAFKNTTFDSTPVLFFDVNENKIGVNTDAPLYDLDIRTDLKTTNLEATSIAEIDNIRMIAPNTVSTKIGPLYLKPKSEGAFFFMNRMQSDDLDFNDNSISGLTSNQPVELRPAGSGTLEIQSNVTIRGTLGVSQNITLDGNVNLKGNITFGDNRTFDTITIKPQFEQNLNPGTDDTFNIGSPTKRWTTLFTPDLTQVDNVNPGAIKVSDQTWIDGVGMKIQGLQSDDDILLSPDTGITHIEDITIQNSNFINESLTTPLQLRTTGIGYVKFDGNNAMIIPYGDSASRPSVPELGDTRWNSDLQYLESFGGRVENLSLVSAPLTGIPDQVVFVTTTTDNSGFGLELQLNIVSETVVTVNITQVGSSYLQGDTITISGNQLSNGTTPANDIVYTVGSQTNDGYIIATGGGEEVTEQIMDDLGIIYSLILA